LLSFEPLRGDQLIAYPAIPPLPAKKRKSVARNINLPGYPDPVADEKQPAPYKGKE
jgi:hypothetical protein